jgi:hypothetical protein
MNFLSPTHMGIKMDDFETLYTEKTSFEYMAAPFHHPPYMGV